MKRELRGSSGARATIAADRAKQQTLLCRAVELKKEQPRRSDVVINHILKQEFGRGVPRSTLYRHLRREGATRRKLGVSQPTFVADGRVTMPVGCGWATSNMVHPSCIRAKPARRVSPRGSTVIAAM